MITDAEVSAIGTATPWRVETRAGSYEAPVLVDAAGAWADELATMAAWRRSGGAEAAHGAPV